MVVLLFWGFELFRIIKNLNCSFIWTLRWFWVWSDINDINHVTLNHFISPSVKGIRKMYSSLSIVYLYPCQYILTLNFCNFLLFNPLITSFPMSIVFYSIVNIFLLLFVLVPFFFSTSILANKTRIVISCVNWILTNCLIVEFTIPHWNLWLTVIWIHLDPSPLTLPDLAFHYNVVYNWPD